MHSVRSLAGFTNIHQALDLMRTEQFNTSADRPEAPNVGILITDGESTVRPARTIPAAVRARDDNITLITYV